MENVRTVVLETGLSIVSAQSVHPATTFGKMVLRGEMALNIMISPVLVRVVASSEGWRELNKLLVKPEGDISTTYIEKLERENLALQQQIRGLNGQRPANVYAKTVPLTHEGFERTVPQAMRTERLPEEAIVVDEAPPRQPVVIQYQEVNAPPSLEILRNKKEMNTYGLPKISKDWEAVVEKDKVKDLRNRHVLTVFREFDSNKQYWRTSIEIFSPSLSDFVKRVPGFIGDLNPAGDVLRLTEPFMELFYNRKVLIDAIEIRDYDIQDIDLVHARAHVSLVLGFMRTDFGDISRKLDDLESKTPSGLITYPELWLLYKPGTIVYSMENGEYEAFVVDSLQGLHKRQGGSNRRYSHGRLDLTCFSINYDGESFGRVWSMHCISPFHGTKEITSLHLIPERFLPNASAVKDLALIRGKHFWSLQGQQYCELQSENTDEEAKRVMIDHLTYQRRHDWPIIINHKQGPANARNKNRRDNIFYPQRHCGDDWDSPRRRVIPSRSPSPPPVDEERDWNPERSSRREMQYNEPYHRYRTERPALHTDDKFGMYDMLEADEEPDELALLLCPQHVHGYCLRDKFWSKAYP